MLAGGGADHDQATSALIEAGGRGDAVILRMDDSGGGYATYFVERGAHSATEIALDAEGGNEDVTRPRLASGLKKGAPFGTAGPPAQATAQRRQARWRRPATPSARSPLRFASGSRPTQRRRAGPRGRASP